MKIGALAKPGLTVRSEINPERRILNCCRRTLRPINLSAFVAVLLMATICQADSNATVAGLITDSRGRAIAGVGVVFTNIQSGFAYQTETNGSGIYRVSGLLPGVYRANVSGEGFSSIVKGDIDLHVQDEVSINFAMRAGSMSESITAEEGAPLLNSESAAVSAVVNREFADNLPSNGRGFQTLINLTPGVVVTASSRSNPGQFSVNGQRSDTSYWTVDGVGANVGTTTRNLFSSGLGGGLPLFSVQGGTNSLVPLDAMREFRIESSTSAAEFGRTPGAQISIVTRSGTNRFHGSVFDYLRNDKLDANDWFAGSQGLSKPQERQNDFGGTFGGPILKERTFFFFSYEGLRLRLPQIAFSFVPDTASVMSGLNIRQNAPPPLRPYLAAFPLPNGPELFDTCNPGKDPACPLSGQKASGAATFQGAFSDRSALDDYSIRIDHALRSNVKLFGRYNYSPSQLFRREPNALSSVFQSKITAHTATVGATWFLSPHVSLDTRFNYSAVNASSLSYTDDFGGATPLAFSPGNPLAEQNSQLTLQIFLPSSLFLVQGTNQRNQQRQFNLIDDLSIQNGRHSWKIGFDFRRLTPLVDPASYSQVMTFQDLPALAAGNVLSGTVQSNQSARMQFQNLGVFVQDGWRIVPRLSLTYGLRWEVDFAPSSLHGPSLVAVTGFNRDDLSQLSLAPPGTPVYRTTFKNFAPRIGIGYQLSDRRKFETGIRGGAGIFYDLATREFGNNITAGSYPIGASKLLSGVSFPLNSSAAAPPQISASDLQNEVLSAFDPKLQLPYTAEWNLAVEQALGGEQTLSATYVGGVGRRLIQSAMVSSPTSTIGTASLIFNSATSDYHGLELKFNGRLAHGLQALASYTWAHSIDDATSSEVSSSPRIVVPALMSVTDRASSDFDIRHAFSTGITYKIPARGKDAFSRAALQGWSLESIVQARSASSVNVYIPAFSQLLDSASTVVRPDVVAGIPLYLSGDSYPGGRALNSTPGAAPTGCGGGVASIGPFCPPPLDGRGFPIRQGNLGRNALRGFGATQWDFAVHREFAAGESLKVQFRAEVFNLLNHPNFGPPSPLLNFGPVTGFPRFGQATEMLGRALSGGNLAGGALDSLYQLGGPRSIQLALRVVF